MWDQKSAEHEGIQMGYRTVTASSGWFWFADHGRLDGVIPRRARAVPTPRPFRQWTSAAQGAHGSPAKPGVGVTVKDCAKRLHRGLSLHAE